MQRQQLLRYYVATAGAKTRFALYSGHLRTLEKCKTLALAPDFYISVMFSNVRRVLSNCNTQLRLLYSLYDLG